MHSHPANAPMADLPTRLLPEENVMGVLEVDLDAALHFSRSTLVVTNRRLLWARAGASDWAGVWPLDGTWSLRHHDHAGVGTLELHDPHSQRAVWRFTLGQNVQALRLVRQFERQCEALRSPAVHAHDDDHDPTTCPTWFSFSATP